MNVDVNNPWLAIQARGGVVGVFQRFVAVGEVLFVLLAFILVARIIFRSLGLVDQDEFIFVESGAPDFRQAAIAESQWHFVRYGLIFLGVYLIGRFRQRRSRLSYGFATGGHSLFWLIAFGIGAYLVVYIPSLSLRIIDHYFDIGPGTPFWSLMKEVEWDQDFWIYMAVSSFLIVPFVEEIAARGYLLGRLRESFSAGGALIIMALIFAAAHTQYHKPDLYSVGTLTSVVFFSIVMGYTVYRTQSLIPAIVAHALVNIPMTLTADYVVAGVIVIGVFVFRRAIGENAARLLSILRATNDWLSITLVGAAVIALGATLQVTPWSPYAWLAGMVGLFVASLFVKSAWNTGA